MIVPQPNFVHCVKHILLRIEISIKQEEANALKVYLETTASIPDKRVYRLVLDTCGITDESFSTILAGIHSQSLCDIVGRVRTQYLHTLIYSNNQLGPKTLEKLEPMMPNLYELTLNNLQFTGGTKESGERIL